MKKAIVLFSGGQDSTTCLLLAIAQYGRANVLALGFFYGQKHSVELEQSQLIINLLQVDYELIDINGTLGGSSLTDPTQSVNDAHQINKNLPSSFTAGRNALFLTIAAAKGYGLGIHDIITGTCQTDFSGYPDCRRIFIDAQQVALSLALDVDIRIHTPLMYLTKAETWKLAADTAVPLQTKEYFGFEPAIDPVQIIREYTMTDYNGDTTMNDWGMGKLDNPASELRAKGYYEAVANGWIE